MDDGFSSRLLDGGFAPSLFCVFSNISSFSFCSSPLLGFCLYVMPLLLSALFLSFSVFTSQIWMLSWWCWWRSGAGVDNGYYFFAFSLSSVSSLPHVCSYFLCFACVSPLSHIFSRVFLFLQSIFIFLFLYSLSVLFPCFLPPLSILFVALLFIGRRRVSFLFIGGNGATLPLQGKVTGHLQGMVLLVSLSWLLAKQGYRLCQ